MSTVNAAILADLPADIVVGTMCHCDEHSDDGLPDPDCDHWEFFAHASGMDDEGHVSRGSHLNEAQMRAIAALVRSFA